MVVKIVGKKQYIVKLKPLRQIIFFSLRDYYMTCILFSVLSSPCLNEVFKDTQQEEINERKKERKR